MFRPLWMNIFAQLFSGELQAATVARLLFNSANWQGNVRSLRSHPTHILDTKYKQIIETVE